MSSLRFTKSFRFRLVLASVLVEVVLLALLVGNSLRLIQTHLIKQTERRVESMELAYSTAVAVPLASRDYATLRDILDGWRRAEDVLYLAVTDPEGKILASSGWKEGEGLPSASSSINLGEPLHVVVPVNYLGQRYGAVHYALNLNFLEVARQDLFIQGSMIALTEIVLSLVLLSLVGYWLTRRLVLLGAASERIAQGDYQTPVPISGEDEIAQLAQNFNVMAGAIAHRIHALAASEANQRALIEHLGEGVFGVDTAGHCTYINPAALSVLGLAEHEVVGSHQHLRFHYAHPDGAEYLEEDCPITKTLKDGMARRLEDWFIHRDGRAIPVLISVTPLLQAGVISGAIVVFMDLRGQIEAKRSLEEAKNAAESANIAKSQFLANMSHELRTPMNAIIGMGQLLQMTTLSDEQEEYVQTIMHGANDLLAVIGDLLDISNLESNQIKLNALSFMPLSVVVDLQRRFAAKAEEKGIRFETKVTGVPCEVVGDAVRLGQILANLLSNAIKFTEQGEVKLHVEFSAAEAGQVGLRFGVEDTGVGMSETVQEKLFSPFFQADQSSTRRYGGTGLGLSLSKRLADLMGGEIVVNSKPAQGSEFAMFIKLPVR